MIMIQIDDIFPAYIDGAIGPCGTLRRFVRDKEYLASRGYAFNVFSRDFLLGHSIENPVDFSKGLSFRSRLKKLFRKNLLLTVLFDIRERREIKKLVLKYLSLNRDPELLVFHEPVCAFYYLKYRNNMRAKVMLFHHSDGLRTKMLLDSYPKLKNTIYLKKIIKDTIWVVNNVERNVFIANIGLKNFISENPNIPQDKLVAFHNGIDDLPYKKTVKPTSYKYNICTTGTVCRRKGQYIIIEALHNISDESRNKIHLSIIGEGNDLEELKQKTKEYGIENNISFLGYMANTKIHDYLSGCDIYILMSSSEGLPISILEAMRAGLGVISTRIAGIPEQVDNDNGILIQPDTEELANVFEHLDEYDWKQMGINSRKKFSDEFTFARMLSSFCDTADDLFNKQMLEV